MKKPAWAPLLALALLAGACNQTTPAQTATAPASPATAPTVTAVAVAETSAAPETIDYRQIRINGLPFETTTAELLKALGPPDRIKKDAVECGGHFEFSKGDHYEYGPSLFEVNGKRAVMGTVDFSSGTFRVTIGGQVLDQNTTFEEIRQRYPQAASKVHDWRPGGTTGPTYQGVTIQEPGTDDSLGLYFQNGKLVRFDAFSPC
ncbi:hypothetical protein [Hymenobacter psychrophilus]|uniref:Lipoprotein n=1 Tax=Hymenobacter psychrophilus TaxID=651662 RepID=A0A1H3LQQ1_9BACT|nr:hypothetical protein [Hymenobacter psychrophilus]SDY66175.1 hypothetical protein SAMN04488069_11170 [Hymenobacter psychrophilus]